MSRADRFYLFITVFLVIAAIAGGVMLAVQHSRSQPVEIVLSQTEPPEQSGELYIPREGEEQSPQKIDINRAESWLLEALPGIGEVTAQAIVDYRNENGNFRRIEDLLKVSGIGPGTFEKIKDYITVSD